MNALAIWIEAFSERAAIGEYERGMARADAEREAALYVGARPKCSRRHPGCKRCGGCSVTWKDFPVAKDCVLCRVGAPGKCEGEIEATQEEIAWA